MPLVNPTNDRSAIKANGHLNGKGAVRLLAGAEPSAPRSMPPPPRRVAMAEPKRRQRTFARQQKAAERVASATGQVASGIAEAASACDQLRASMTEIASGAAEAASAAEQSQRAITRIAANIRSASDAAELSERKTSTLQELLGSVNAQIGNSIASVGRAADRQSASVTMVGELDRQASSIGDIVKAVARIADQTNLLALNAAIEAARAGQHGKGFAVVADEVRTLAETSEKSARDIQDLVGQIQQEVKGISDGINASAMAARSEVESGRTVAAQLDALRDGMVRIVAGAREIRQAASESTAAAGEAQKGSEAISAAAQEQSAACEEAMRTVDHQTTTLSESERSAAELAEIADELKNSTDISKSAEEVASASEQLSAAVEEINRSAAEIMTAVEQISRGAQQQAAATQQSSAAIEQIQKSARISSERAQVAVETGEATNAALQSNTVAIGRMIAGVEQSVRDNSTAREQMRELEKLGRRIDKIVDAITTVSIQTNMLAVNGAVEAARAGEFGKGFMVVSTDIRNLARDSSENADQIKDLVKSVQDHITAVRRDLEETAAMAASEVDKNKAISANLAAVATEIDVVLEGNREIARGAAEILDALGEAKRGVEQVSSAASQASAAAAQAAQATRQQSKGAEELASAVEEIASLADELQNSEAA